MSCAHTGTYPMCCGHQLGCSRPMGCAQPMGGDHRRSCAATAWVAASRGWRLPPPMNCGHSMGCAPPPPEMLRAPHGHRLHNGIDGWRESHGLWPPHGRWPPHRQLGAQRRSPPHALRPQRALRPPHGLRPRHEQTPQKCPLQDTRFRGLLRQDTELGNLIRSMMTKPTWQRPTIRRALNAAVKLARPWCPPMVHRCVLVPLS